MRHGGRHGVGRFSVAQWKNDPRFRRRTAGVRVTRMCARKVQRAQERPGGVPWDTGPDRSRWVDVTLCGPAATVARGGARHRRVDTELLAGSGPRCRCVASGIAPSTSGSACRKVCAVRQPFCDAVCRKSVAAAWRDHAPRTDHENLTMARAWPWWPAAGSRMAQCARATARGAAWWPCPTHRGTCVVRTRLRAVALLSRQCAQVVQNGVSGSRCSRAAEIGSPHAWQSP